MALTMNFSIKDYLQSNWQFIPTWVNKNCEGIDIHKFDSVKRIDIVHYLFWSDTMKLFTIGLIHDNPKGQAGVKGTGRRWTFMDIPKIIYTPEQANNLLNSII